MTEEELEDVVADAPPAVAEEDADARTSWVRRYPPLLSMLGGLLIAVLVMPSALNLPQTNPTEQLEYAPVPPEDSDDPPPPGNFDDFGLGSSETQGGGGAPGGADGGITTTTATLPPPLGPGTGDDPSRYRCVDGRQTEDPLSPPCVAFFDGDNFGATYQGVEADEIKILVYVDGSIIDNGTSRGAETRPERTYVDLVNDPPQEDEHVYLRVLRGWQSYFNDRYQTYGRYVHFFVYFSGADRSPESRRADAADNFKRVNPFATLNLAAFDGGGDAYLDSMLKRGVLNFGSFLGQEKSFFDRYPGLLWGYLPSLEIQAQQYGDVLCKKYADQPVVHSGQFNGQERKFGLVYTADRGFATLRRFKDNVLARLQTCGIEIAEEATFPKAGYGIDTTQGNRYAIDAMTRFKTAGVTTVIWPGGYESQFSKAAAQVNYLPEWVLAGDGYLDGEYGNQVTQDQSVWQYAVTVSNQVFVPDDLTTQLCFQAFRTVAPEAPRQDVNAYACQFYNDLRQLFIGIQVAGPRLGPTAINKGFHAIPAVRSPNPQVPACFYLPGDYTCIKDVVIARWNPSARAEQGTTGGADAGCWQFAEAKRYLIEEIPGGNATAQMKRTDPCLGYDNGFQQSLGAPDPENL